MHRGENAGQSKHGAWVPWDLALAIGGLSLMPSSRWQVFVAVLFPWCRYGEAWLTIEQISERTGLSKRTAQAAVSDLITGGLVRRIGRRGKLAVVPEAITTRKRNNDPRRYDDGPHDRLHRDLRIGDPGNGPSGFPALPAQASGETATFTPKQRAAIEGCFAAASNLLGEDARGLVVPESTAAKLGIASPVTYGRAFRILDQKGNHPARRLFVGAVLKLRYDERVQGRELDSSISK
jgi:hypothetical protein